MIPRCLDCGADRTSDVCEACGLTSLEAELAFRRRLLSLLLIFVLGSLAFLPASHYYPPLELDGILIFFGVIFFASIALAAWLDYRARKHREVEALKRIFRALVPLPWLLASLLWVNGKFDASPARSWTVVVTGKSIMPGTLRESRLTVESWRFGRTIERIPVSRDDYTRFAPGDRIEVRLQDGLVGIPWVYAVYRK
jgi:hypothetical protein